MKGCSNLKILTEAETAAELERLGLNTSDIARPIRLELIVERDKGNLSEAEFNRLMAVAR